MNDMPSGRYTVPFWEALSEGSFLVHRCEGCVSLFFPPSPVCPHCGSQDVDWHEVSGQGSLYSFTRQHTTPPGFEAPLVVGLVKLAAGPRFLTPIAADYGTLTIGTSVEVVPAAYDWSYDRGDLSDYPYFEAVPVSDDVADASGSRQ